MTSKRNIFFSVAIMFSFLWVIIGDLVAMHLNVIYNVDVYNIQPFAKTKKSDQKCFKIKNDKLSSDNSQTNLFYVAESYQTHLQNYVYFIFSAEQQNLIYWSVYLPVQGRAPPVS